MSLAYLKEAVESGDQDALIRYVRLHVGDGSPEAGKLQIDKAWVEALKALIAMPETDQPFIDDTLKEQDHGTLAHLFFRLHFYLVKHSGEWIHDGHV
jgi:hypothetical protein